MPMGTSYANLFSADNSQLMTGQRESPMERGLKLLIGDPFLRLCASLPLWAFRLPLPLLRPGY